jgi:type IV pilus assembly protein PilC
MAAVGEESGSLDGLMAKVADYYEQELAEAVARLSNLIEPVLMVVLGLLIGGVVIAMYLPVFRMGSVL